jgi:hypothetical protein
VKRHIKEKSRTAAAALKKLCKDHPLIYRWPHWPGATAAKSSEADTEAATLADWEKFLTNFKVEKLGYTEINLDQVMDSYDKQVPPFGEGEKRKEFPDAFAVAAIAAYSKANNVRVAIVSADPDIKKACALHPKLVHFEDLPALTEALIDEVTKTPQIKGAVASNPADILARIREAFPDLSFYPEEDYEGDVQDVEVTDVELSNIRVIDIKAGYCTIAFDADVTFSAFVEYGDPDTMIIDTGEDIRMPLFMRAGTVTETASISGTIYLDFDKDLKNILSAYDLELNTDTIEVQTRPPISHDDDEPPEDLEEPRKPPEPDDSRSPEPPEPPEPDDLVPLEPTESSNPDDSEPPTRQAWPNP